MPIVISVEGPIHSIPMPGWAGKGRGDAPKPCRDYGSVYMSWEALITIVVTLDFSKVKLAEGETLYLVQEARQVEERTYDYENRECDKSNRPFLDIFPLPTSGTSYTSTDHPSRTLGYNPLCSKVYCCRLERDQTVQVYVAKISRKKPYGDKELDDDRDRAMSDAGTVGGSYKVSKEGGKDVESGKQDRAKYETKEKDGEKVQYKLPSIDEFMAANNVTKLPGEAASYSIYPKVPHCKQSDWTTPAEVPEKDRKPIPATVDDKGDPPKPIQEWKPGDPVPPTKGTKIDDAEKHVEYKGYVQLPDGAGRYDGRAFVDVGWSTLTASRLLRPVPGAVMSAVVRRRRSESDRFLRVVTLPAPQVPREPSD